VHQSLYSDKVKKKSSTTASMGLPVSRSPSSSTPLWGSVVQKYGL
jgi:hypothetical protein